ncbi:MAG: type IV pili twitching motility protein PilT, partial [Nitrospiria bacterium]
SGGGRCLALEILIPNSAIRNLIREDKIHQIYSSMQTGQEKNGMQTLNQSLYELVIKKYISKEAALQQSSIPEELAGMFNRGGMIHNPQDLKTGPL